MTSLDLPPLVASPLTRLDPRWKLAALMPAVIAAAMLRTLPAAGTALLLVLVLACGGRIPIRWLCGRLTIVFFFVAMLVVWLPFFMESGGRELDLGWVRLSLPGMERAGVVLCKSLAIAALFLIVLATAPLHDTFKAAQALGLPAFLAYLLLLTYRYLFLLGEEFRRLRVALRVRGFHARTRWHTYRTLGQTAGTLLVRGQERAERVAQAMRARGFDGRFRSLQNFHTHWQDVVFFLIVLALAAGLLWWEWA